jgi:hypothetical protein
MPPVGFEPTIPASEWPRVYTLDRAATGFDIQGNYKFKPLRLEQYAESNPWVIGGLIVCKIFKWEICPKDIWEQVLRSILEPRGQNITILWRK